MNIGSTTQPLSALYYYDYHYIEKVLRLVKGPTNKPLRQVQTFSRSDINVKYLIYHNFLIVEIKISLLSIEY